MPNNLLERRYTSHVYQLDDSKYVKKINTLLIFLNESPLALILHIILYLLAFILPDLSPQDHR